GSSHCKKMTFLPFGGVLLSACVTWMVLGGVVGGGDTTAFCELWLLELELVLLSLELPHAAKVTAAPRHSGSTCQRNLFITPLLLVGLRSRGPAETCRDHITD